jgi:hypothetical protein
MSDLKKFIITLHSHEDLAQFYDDMETPGGGAYYPDREVGIAARRPKSRNTHYWLTQEEASLIRLDPRVEDVIPEELITITRRPSYTQTSTNWNKTFTNTNTHVNWGLLRCVEGVQRNFWGADITPSQSGTITVNNEGRNVDVLIVDGHITPLHPEYAINSNGTGGSRVVQYDWFQNSLAVEGIAKSPYVYEPYVDGGDADRTADNNHGAHVAGTVAGNTQGWARSSNIYNISPYATNQNPNAANFLYDYIREFHENKPINPLTGRKNPTIMNCSYGAAIEWNQGSFGPITRAVYRGVDTGTVPAGLTTAQLNANGIYDAASNQRPVVPYYTSADAADIQDLIDLGVIVVAASGNEYFYTANSTDQDWNNYFYATFDSINYIWYYHRGCAPAAISNVISVGAVGNTANETKAVFSNNGPGVDIFAPGTAIMSSLNSGGTTDSRNASYRLGKFQGTSMASPQVCGVLACVLETYPNMNQLQAREYIFANSVLNQMTNTGESYTDTTSLNGATNRYLRYKEERPSTGVVFPKKDYFVRPASGAVYPRTRIRKT